MQFSNVIDDMFMEHSIMLKLYQITMTNDKCWHEGTAKMDTVK